MTHQSKENLQYTNQYLSGKLCLWQAIPPTRLAVTRPSPEVRCMNNNHGQEHEPEPEAMDRKKRVGIGRDYCDSLCGTVSDAGSTSRTAAIRNGAACAVALAVFSTAVPPVRSGA